jgi:hypothetical protein
VYILYLQLFSLSPRCAVSDNSLYAYLASEAVLLGQWSAAKKKQEAGKKDFVSKKIKPILHLSERLAGDFC